MAFALLTGASGGIGLCMAYELASKNHDLLLVARSGDKLKSIAASITEKYKVKVETLSLDLSVAGSANTLAAWVTSNQYPVDILINNAGYGIWGTIESTPQAQLNNMMQLNMITLAEVCQLLIPELKKHPKSYILNVASTASYQAVPTLATYAASKSFVVLFTRGLRKELSGSTVSVTCLSPGATSTNFIDRAGMDSLKERAEKFSMSPEEVAKSAIRGMFKGKAEIIPGFVNWLSVQFTYLLPKSIPENIAAGLYKTKP
ncbi:MAG: SDR family oxidoreductase [Bacteroidetes bacterium]|nr:SDR family oxidoreductase [Bacteroidota bacterium]